MLTKGTKQDKKQVSEKLATLIDRREEAVDIAVVNPSFWDRILGRKVRRFFVHDLTLSEVAKIFAVIEDIDFSEFVRLVENSADSAGFFSQAEKFVNSYRMPLMKVLGVFLNTDDYLWLERNLTMSDILQLLSLLFEKLNLDDFFGSLGLLAAAQSKSRKKNSTSS